MKPLADCRLYAFIDTAYFHGRAPEVFAQQLCDGGADLIQLRAKKSSPDEIRRMAEEILPVTRRANVGLVINDHLDIARETGAEFCHLGQEDFFDAGHTQFLNSQLSTLPSPLAASARPRRNEVKAGNSKSVCPPTRRSRRSALWPPDRITSPSGRSMRRARSRRRNR